MSRDERSPQWPTRPTPVPYVYPVHSAQATPYGTPHPDSPHFDSAPPVNLYGLPAGISGVRRSSRGRRTDSSDRDVEEEETFMFILGRLHHFESSDDKLGYLQTHQGHRYRGAQIVEVLKTFPQDSDKISALQLMEPHLCKLTGSEGRQIVDSVTRPTDKVQTVKIMAKHIEGSSKHEVLQSIDFPGDYAKAKAILDQTD